MNKQIFSVFFQPFLSVSKSSVYQNLQNVVILKKPNIFNLGTTYQMVLNMQYLL